VINVLLSGGSGTRLWPLSRAMLPKQFVRLFDGRSLFQETVLRNASLCTQTIVVSNTNQYFLVVDQLSDLSISSSFASSMGFLLEPVGRNTAPAIALACLLLDPDEVVLVTPSDHRVLDELAYHDAVLQAEAFASEGDLVTFGVLPRYAETGFGYIEANGDRVCSFREKPDVETAQRYLAQGNYFWNAGLFCFQAGAFLAELGVHAPAMLAACRDALAASPIAERGVVKIDREAMLAIPAESVDYAVMERSARVRVVPCEMGWSDLGSFDALNDELRAEAMTSSHDNAVLARHADAPAPICVDARGNFVVTRDRQVALIDVDDLLVVDTMDALLISKKGSAQKVREVVTQVKARSPELTEVHHLVHRPWGTYEVLMTAEGYKVKRIVVKPGGRLSLQKHHQRNEHWVVVSGAATVTVDGVRSTLSANESTYIKMGYSHRLENDGADELVMIEVQVGAYVGEDDIVRLEDVYGR
jgi:mannose-1-phosphate guanylyltransferase